MKKAIRVFLIVILLGVFLFSGWKVTEILQEYRRGKQTYDQMEQFVSFTEPERSEEIVQKEEDAPVEEIVQKEETVPTEHQEDTLRPYPSVDFDSLRQLNSDVVGWIYIPDTEINYPVVQGKDNEQYLHHMINGEYNDAGSIFLQTQIPSDFSGQNSPIYGHNMKNGTMFADITGYKNQQFYDAHPVAYLITPEEVYLVHIFSGYVSDTWDDAWQTQFSEEEFSQWLSSRQRKSYFTPIRNATVEDRILTFSTCTYETENSRFVVHGFLEVYGNE